jgi:hypothetical protein
MPELSDLLKRPVEGECDWCGVVVKFTANRGAFTHEYEKQLRQALAKAREEGEDASVHEFYAKTLPPLLLTWDLMDDKKSVPITGESLLGLPLPFLQALTEAVRDANAPFETKPKPESSGSFS